MKLIKKTPMAASALSLSLASLGNLLLPYGQAVRYACGILSAAIFFIFLIKLITDFEHVKEELKNPVVCSVFPTSTMTAMLLCVYVKPFIGSAAVYLWYAAVVAHVPIMLLFARRFVLKFKIQTVFPSWFIVCAGIVVASVTSPAMNAVFVGQISFYIGFVLYFVALPVVLYRVFTVKPIPEPALPTKAIFAAPMSLCIAGYFSVFEQKNALLIYIMLAIAIISYIYVSISMISLLKLKFYPTYAAFTFPYVISAIAFKMANAFLVEKGFSFFTFMPKISELLAIIIVVYVLCRYIIFLVSSPIKA